MRGVFFCLFYLLVHVNICNTFTYDLNSFTLGYYKFGLGGTRTLDTTGRMANIVFLDTVYLVAGMCTPAGQSVNTVAGGWIETCTLTPFNTPFFNVDQSFSVCIWEFLNTQQQAYVIFEVSNADYVFKVGYTVTSQLYTEITVGGVVTTTTAVATYSLWVHVCVTFSPTQYVLYVNSVVITTKPLTIIKDCNQVFALYKRQAVVVVSELRLFNKTLNINDVNALMIRRSPTNAQQSVQCSISFECTPLSLSSTCSTCDTGFYKAVDPYTYCATHTINYQVTYCYNCTRSGQCMPGTYLNYECDGTNPLPNACIQCSTGPCLEGKFRRVCQGTQDSICSETSPTCPSGYYLANANEYSGGVCTPCNSCTDYAQVCSQYSNAICKTGCSMGVSCPSNQPRSVCVLQSKSSSGNCFTCPTGYYTVNNVCVECTKGTICNANGISLYNGRCPYLTQPSMGATSFQCAINCNAVSFNTITTKYVSSYIDQSCYSNPVCLNGYYLQASSDAKSLICTACTTSLSSVAAVTPGLFIHDATSCVWETSLRNNGNSRGYYGSSGSYFACGNSQTSEANNALYASDCKPCPTVNTNNMIITSSEMCEWNCINGFTKIAEICLGTTFELQNMCTGNGYSQVNGICVIRPLPFQPAGYSFFNYDTVSLSFSYPQVYRSTILYNPFTINTPLLKITTTTKDYFSDMQYNNLTVNSERMIVPGKVCSVTVGSGVIYVVYCGMSIIFYLDSQRNSKRLIGNSTNGYQEGMKNDALFESELYITYVSDRIVVLDTFNCMIREVIVAASGPGDFRTKSYWVYGVRDGYNQPVCSGANSLNTPKRWYVLQPNYLAFVNNYQYICQYQTINKRVLCLQNSFTEPIVGLFATTNGYQLFIEYENSYTVMSDPGQPCPELDYISVPGGICDVSRPWNNGAFSTTDVKSYYIVNGVAYECTPAICQIGEYAGLCARDGPSTCIPCIVNNPNTIRFTTVNTCDYVFAPPCPVDTYADSTYQNCIDCPDLMYTDGVNKSSIRDCKCPFPLINENNNNCVVPPNTNLFPVYQPNSCYMYEYKSTTTNLCTSCLIDPCSLPNIGEYPTQCTGTMSTCTIPANSYATSMGLLNQPTSCSWSCNNGYYKSGAGCVGCPSKPDNTYYSDGCLWVEYI